MKFMKILFFLIISVASFMWAIEPPPPSQEQTPPSSDQTQVPTPNGGSSTYSGTITSGAKSLTNVDEMPSEFPDSSGTVSAPSPSTPSGTAQAPSSASSVPEQEPHKKELPSGTAQAPSGTVQVPSGNTCSMLKNPDHLAFANKLQGNEQILFCSIFDDSQRDQAIFYTKNKQMTPKDAVIQVGKDAGLLFSQTPGGACGAH